jgi:type IV pilus assembly protein PilN
MIRINLLPVRHIRKKQRLLKEVAGFGLVLIVLAITLTLFGMSLARQVETLQQQISALNVRKASFNKMLAEIKQMEKDKDLLEKKVAAIRQLKKSSQISVRVLDELASRTPTQRLWLESLNHSPGKLVIKGVALDNATIAQYMDQLAASPYFADPDLAGTSLKEIAGNQLKSFSLTVVIVQPEPPAPPAG